MAFVLVSSSAGKDVYKQVTEPVVKSKYTGELEEIRKGAVGKMVNLLLPTAVAIMSYSGTASASSNAKDAEKIRQGFSEILDLFTAIAEPILWFYALTACILMATKSKDAGLNRLKQVAYAYGAIALLPTFFALIRWIADMIKGSIQF